ncbi:MAG: Lon protease family protein [Candidatus Tectimicrobiota bacterium]
MSAAENQAWLLATPTSEALRVSAAELRWSCDAAWLPFRSTAEVAPLSGVVGQDEALEALRFGLEVSGPGQNVFVRGLPGSGRLTLVRQLIEDLRPSCPLVDDCCYVHNFTRPDHPRLLRVPRAQGLALSASLETLILFIQRDLAPFLGSDVLRTQRAALDDRLQEAIRRVGDPLEAELQANHLALVPLQAGNTVQPTLLPVRDGQPLTPERFRELRAQGSIDEATAARIYDQIAVFSQRVAALSEQIAQIQQTHRDEVQQLYAHEARRVLQSQARQISEAFPQPEVGRFLDEVIDDVVTRRLATLTEDTTFTRLYRVNVVLPHGPDEPCPMVLESAPTMTNLLGLIEREWLPSGSVRSDHMMIRAGALLRADGGFLILEARDVLSEPGAWKVLVRTLRSGRLEIMPAELAGAWSGPLLTPEPIPINIKVVLLGDPGLYALLDNQDPDFAQLFKVLADFDTSIARDRQGVESYAGYLAQLVQQEHLLPFTREAVIALTEGGARIAARRDRLTTQFGRLADIAREATFLARRAGTQLVTEAHIQATLQRRRSRADRPARHFRTLIAEGTLRIQTRGAEVGQVNGLAVMHAGPLIYGFPTRITATIGPGTAGTINIEREAELSGAIHTKGFYILSGLLRFLLRSTHPLAFSASIAFEQSYGGIDGDSASGAEICCLLSALTDVPVRQDLAMTGAIDQVGHILPVGAVTNKIEGFFDTCQDLGLTGHQGVLIPRANLGELMLRPDVVTACEEGRFHVYAVETIQQALELLTGRVVGTRQADGSYPEYTLLHLAMQRAQAYWHMVAPRPGV